MSAKQKRKSHKLVKVEVIIDQTAEGSLALVERLREVGSVEPRGDGIFDIDLVTEQAVLDVADQYPQVVMKVDVV